ncbi:MAG TPA: 6-carboxytetrahydropterin synthase [Ferruginibacter sp.]|nr:6-carboxytetrahydropterin synthase [Ferruginibacter sp.]HRO17375.1 6-carboxytetrahydropterin synthase [Ferruginibacter sp.]HRQ21090.1 6-carboxytetrahydropterin synthase [Ferruginibacter sp.]
MNISKVFHFEAAHALYGYDGPCKHIHGHSYRLIITVSTVCQGNEYIPAPGILLDFKELKKMVSDSVLNKLDHALILSARYLQDRPCLSGEENLLVLPAEPSAENLLIYIRQLLSGVLPPPVRLVCLKLYETQGSLATWHHSDAVALNH